jgi:hypothetical protein
MREPLSALEASAPAHLKNYQLFNILIRLSSIGNGLIVRTLKSR